MHPQRFTSPLLALLFLLCLTAFAPPVKTLEIKVQGNCGLCKARIERALKLAGVRSVNWNAETQTATVVYVEGRVTPAQLHLAAAAAGHDTNHETAPQAAYDQLPACCHYRGANGHTH